MELLVVVDCANQRPAAEVLREALELAGLDAGLETVLIETEQQATARRFIGSPSFHLDGSDLFPHDSAPPALACRTYPTGQGMRGTPSAVDLAHALRARLDTHGTSCA